MCTIVLAHRYVSGRPVVLAVNRDERYDRPSRPPARIEDAPEILAPIDLEAGGTWVGVNEHDVVAAIANRPEGPDGERSRGWLVRTALRCRSAEAARDRVQEALASASYAGCYLLVADRSTASVLAWDGQVRTDRLAPGVHVLVNAGLDDPPKARRVADRLEDADPELPADWLATLRTSMADHELETCVHRAGAGTRSLSLITVASGATTYDYADGPPCITPLGRVTKWER